MPTLSSYVNVYGTALQVLKEKGYQLWFDAEANVFMAERDGWDFAGRSPCDLLGMIAIFEQRQPSKYVEYWWRKEEVDWNHLPREPAPYQSVLITRRPAP